MKFELSHALRGLEDPTPQFFKLEAISDESEGSAARDTAIRVLATPGDMRAVKLLKEIIQVV